MHSSCNVHNDPKVQVGNRYRLPLVDRSPEQPGYRKLLNLAMPSGTGSARLPRDGGKGTVQGQLGLACERKASLDSLVSVPQDNKHLKMSSVVTLLLSSWQP